MNDAWELTEADSPIIAAALHDGHAVRPEVAEWLLIDEETRLREEDPYTARWTAVAPARVVGRRSRFEFDLNRERELAIYLDPAQSWGLQVWKNRPPVPLIEKSLQYHDGFYQEMHRALSRMERRHRRFVVLDLHSYNHRRSGPDAPPEDPAKNPDINIGTGSMDRGRWGPLVDRFIDDLRRQRVLGRTLDVRENIRFRGGGFPRWVHRTFPGTGCALAIEMKKFFMNEWTGEPDEEAIAQIGQALRGTMPGLLESIRRSGSSGSQERAEA
jgi:N-formylglutamate deformylase